MYLSDHDIQLYRAMGKLDIEPWNPLHLQAASYDLTLGEHFQRPVMNGVDRDTAISMREEMLSHLVSAQTTGILLLPGECVLGTTVETVRLGSELSGEVFGRSSVGRRWLTVHVSAGFVDPGFEGQLTLEIVNHSPYTQRLLSGMRMAQLVFSMLRTPSTRPYGTSGSKYQHQEGATASRLHLDQEVAHAV